MTTVTTETQIAAWETYRLAKRRADKTLDFLDGRAAAMAWNAFVAVFVEECPPTPIDLRHDPKVTHFPANKVRRLGGAR